MGGWTWNDIAICEKNDKTKKIISIFLAADGHFLNITAARDAADDDDTRESYTSSEKGAVSTAFFLKATMASGEK